MKFCLILLVLSSSLAFAADKTQSKSIDLEFAKGTLARFTYCKIHNPLTRKSTNVIVALENNELVIQPIKYHDCKFLGECFSVAPTGHDIVFKPENVSVKNGILKAVDGSNEISLSLLDFKGNIEASYLRRSTGKKAEISGEIGHCN